MVTTQDSPPRRILNSTGRGVSFIHLFTQGGLPTVVERPVVGLV